MKKVLMILLTLSLAMGTLMANGGSDSGATVEVRKPVKLTWSSVSVPNDAHTKAMQVFKLELERISDGEMEVEVYHSGQLFTRRVPRPPSREALWIWCIPTLHG